MGSISNRKSIRWLPHEASEPTSTIVLTSPQRRFVDLRIFDSTPHKSGPRGMPGQLGLEQLEWGIGGTSSSTKREENGEVITRGRWDHWIDSRTADEVADEGDMFPISETTTLEKGRMVNPETGLETDYEEVWEDEEPKSIPGAKEGVSCVVVRMEEGVAKGLIVVLGRYAQGILRLGDGSVAAERWVYDDGWKLYVKFGDGGVPCKVVLGTLGDVTMGQGFGCDGRTWTVIEMA
ncbi:hypothetical protein CC79DRAFT_1300760 [Sarocladium strictum]